METDESHYSKEQIAAWQEDWERRQEPQAPNRFAGGPNELTNLVIDRVPRSVEEESLLLRTRPPGWECLLFGAVLLRGRNTVDGWWEGRSSRTPFPPGTVLSDKEALDYLENALKRNGKISARLGRCMSPWTQRRAFGKSGKPGNPGRITKLADGIVGCYQEWLEWSADLRAAPVRRKYGDLFDIASEMGDAPISQLREFIDRTVEELDDLPRAMREEGRISLVLDLELELDEEVMQRYYDELARLQGARPVRRSIAGRSEQETQRARRPIPESVRHEVWRRDEGRCVDCGSRVNLEYDHIVPVSRGGSNTARNIELRCESCNRKKGARV